MGAIAVSGVATATFEAWALRCDRSGCGGGVRTSYRPRLLALQPLRYARFRADPWLRLPFLEDAVLREEVHDRRICAG